MRVITTSIAAVLKINVTAVRLSSSTFIAMVQTANLWQGDDIAEGNLHATRPRAIFAEREMRSSVVMVLKIAR
jgi:hypothetical protein